MIVENGSFTWDVTSRKEPLLRGLNIWIRTGELVAVVGATGSGKSSFIAAIIGQMMKIEGRVNVTVSCLHSNGI